MDRIDQLSGSYFAVKGIFPDTIATLGNHGVALRYLCTWWDVLAEARTAGHFGDTTLAEVERFLNAPRPKQDARKAVLSSG